MCAKIILHESVLVYSAPVNKATGEWGVYAIPRLWRGMDGRLVIRFNGEKDTANTGDMQQAPNLYFYSDDNGETWTQGEESDISILTGINPPCVKLKNGDILAIKAVFGLPPIRHTAYTKEFEMPNHEAIVHAYKYADIPDECKGIRLLKKSGGKITETDAKMDFPDREVLVNAKALVSFTDGFVPVDEYILPFIFKSPYLSSLTELPDGTLAAVCCGQNPLVLQRYSGEVYLVVSEDGGATWKKRAVIASNAESPEYGYGGDGGEVSLAVTDKGELVCAMRMDMSINPDEKQPVCGTMFSSSHDMGFTWEEPREISDSSVTPHVIALKDGIIAAVYGRPGVHLKYSEDCGKTWSESFSIIGKTLEEERALGKSDSASKYFDTSSYSNTFIEMLDESTFIIVYNDMKYKDADNLNHKAAFVKKITITKD